MIEAIHNCLVIAGEKSGEEHCLSFFSELVDLCPTIKLWGVGGDDLQKNGLELILVHSEVGHAASALTGAQVSQPLV